MQSAVTLSPEQIALVVGALVANAGALIGAYVSIRVKLGKLEVYVDILRKDMNALGSMLRKNQKGETL